MPETRRSCKVLGSVRVGLIQISAKSARMSSRVGTKLTKVYAKDQELAGSGRLATYHFTEHNFLSEVQ
jgi:hypothetical protein